MAITVETTEAFDTWLDNLADARGREAIAMRIVRLQSGLMGDAASVGDQVSELRIHHGPGYRVYFTRRGQRIVILLCGGEKGSQKRDIKRAKDMAAEL
ncbi:MAG: type II toxin-antitoxin system RelE/ParE family toxin [Thermaurantiacus sp.]